MRLLAWLLFVSFFSLSAAHAEVAIPKNAHACFLVFQAKNLERAGFSCDGSPMVELDRSGNDGAATISGKVALFVSAGYRMLNCQYALSDNVANSQYTCMLTR